jgi:hypothetical protein
MNEGQENGGEKQNRGAQCGFHDQISISQLDWCGPFRSSSGEVLILQDRRPKSD